MKKLLKSFKRYLPSKYQREKYDDYITAFVFAILIMSSFYMFWTSFHNVDNLVNFAVIRNDINFINFGNETQKFYNMRDIQDCISVDNCPYFDEMYIKSVNTGFIGYYLLLVLLIILLVREWNRRKYPL